MLWEVEIRPAPGERNRAGERIEHEAADLGLARGLRVLATHGFLIQGELTAAQVEQLAAELLSDPVVEIFVIAKPQDPGWQTAPTAAFKHLVHVLPKPGVMDPAAESAQQAIADCGQQIEAVRTFRKYWLSNLADADLKQLCGKLLANDAIEQAVIGPLTMERLDVGKPYEFQLLTVLIRELNDAQLQQLSRTGQLYLQLAEMRTIRDYYRELGRDPTDAELETLAQTWSEHCSHKTLAGRVHYRGPEGERRFENMLKETIFAATVQLRAQMGSDDWCVSVFKDNAGIIRFDDKFNVVMKVETHNHPSALEPYGGANTGLGGVIRDPLGTGMGAKPICNTDVFCFAPPDTPADSLPPGVLHPRRVMKGVVSGVRDYGNRMGIPTVNGALCFDERYLGNPLVYCGNVGLIPIDKSEKEPLPGDFIVALGGRTGRDGIHGATFSSAELTSESESLSGGAVQIGNAITEKMVLDVVLQARDRGLFHAITDCGAGGFSSAVGEMGAEIGARVNLEQVPLKYAGLNYTEIWISEAQERMILAVGEDQWPALNALCTAEGVEATIIGEFAPTGRLELFYHAQPVADLDFHFLHDGRPPVVRPATYTPRTEERIAWPSGSIDVRKLLLSVLSDLNVASKEWVIRQYDHEVQAGSAVKPLVGVNSDGPGDAAVVRPVLSSKRGLVVSCGLAPSYGDYDTYHMAASAIDEAIRNAVAVGADPARIAILDNFCWGDCEKPEMLGALVRAALACYDLALAFKTPFISGKDSLNNEFRYQNAAGEKVSIAIPHTLLISALGQVENVERCVTMDLKRPGNRLFIVGETHAELAGSRVAKAIRGEGGRVPTVNPQKAVPLFAAMHRAIHQGLVRSCHDLSEGGLAAALAEMAFAGGFGAEVSFDTLPGTVRRADFATEEQFLTTMLFSESNSRFVCEVAAESVGEFLRLLGDVAQQEIGIVAKSSQLRIATGKNASNPAKALAWELVELKRAWQEPLSW